MSEREIYVELEWDEETWSVTDDHDRWLASFLNKEDAEEYAERKRLEP